MSSSRSVSASAEAWLLIYSPSINGCRSLGVDGFDLGNPRHNLTLLVDALTPAARNSIALDNAAAPGTRLGALGSTKIV